MGPSRPRWKSRCLVPVVTALLVLHASPVAPATIEVGGSCTLADAIAAANEDDDSGGLCPPGGSGADVLVLTGDVSLYAPLPTVVSEVTIEGRGFTIERAEAAEPFPILGVQGERFCTLPDTPDCSGVLTVRDATVRNGSRGVTVRWGRLVLTNSTLSGHRTFGLGGGGAVFNYYGDVTIDHSTLSGNYAERGGGAIRHYLGFSSPLTITNTTLSNNDSGLGGAIYTAPFYELQASHVTDITIHNTRFLYNTAVLGGAIWNETGARIEVTDSEFVGNSASGGGAIFNWGGIALTGVTLANNVATHDGGAIVDVGGMTVTNSTLSGNEAARLGGAVYGFGVMALRNSTIVGNVAEAGGGFYDYAPFSWATGTIVAGNAGGDCVAGLATFGTDSFDGDGSCGTASPIVPGVDFDTTLADNGGPTRTHALLPGSVAAGAAGDCGLATDQRGVMRHDGACDAGAFELVAGACCTDGPGTESECIVVDQSVCELAGGRFLGEASACEHDLDCTALYVSMESMSAVAGSEGVVVRWTTALEVDTVGFRVLRRTGGARTKRLEPVGGFMAANGSEVTGGSYEVLDTSPAAGRARQYFIEDLDRSGRATRHGPIVVTRDGGRAPR